MIERAEVERLLEVASDPLFTSAIKVPAKIAAELCRTWLAVEAAPEGVVEEEMSGLVIYASPLPKGKRVRLVVAGEG